MRLTDADALAKVFINERNRIRDTYGENDEYVQCLNKYALSIVESAPTIDAILVEWLQEKMNIADDAGDLDSADLISWLIQTWAKEQETFEIRRQPIEPKEE